MKLYEEVEIPEPSNLFDDFSSKGDAVHKQKMDIATCMSLTKDLKAEGKLYENDPKYKERYEWVAQNNPEFKEAVQAKAISVWTLDDEHSVVANAQFVDAENGNFNVASTSPAIGVGSRNFPVTGFGVTADHLKKIAPEPEIILPTQFFNNQIKKNVAVSVFGAKIENLDTESKLTVYGARIMSGAIIMKLPPSSVLKRMGFEMDDVVLKIDKHDIKNAKDFVHVIGKVCKPSQVYRVKFLRMQEEKEMIIKF